MACVIRVLSIHLLVPFYESKRWAIDAVLLVDHIKKQVESKGLLVLVQIVPVPSDAEVVQCCGIVYCSYSTGTFHRLLCVNHRQTSIPVNRRVLEVYAST